MQTHFDVSASWTNEAGEHAVQAAALCAAELHKRADQLRATLLKRKAGGVADDAERERLNRAIVRIHQVAAALDDAIVAAAGVGPPGLARAGAIELGYGLRVSLRWGSEFPRQGLKDLGEICQSLGRALTGVFRDMRNEHGLQSGDPQLAPVVIAQVWLRMLASHLAAAVRAPQRATGRKRVAAT